MIQGPQYYGGGHFLMVGIYCPCCHPHKWPYCVVISVGKGKPTNTASSHLFHLVVPLLYSDRSHWHSQQSFVRFDLCFPLCCGPRKWMYRCQFAVYVCVCVCVPFSFDGGQWANLHQLLTTSERSIPKGAIVFIFFSLHFTMGQTTTKSGRRRCRSVTIECEQHIRKGKTEQTDSL